jgi:hypothetical protein
VLEVPREMHRRKGLATLIKGGRGAIDSGVPDLTSNPEHLAVSVTMRAPIVVGTGPLVLFSTGRNSITVG